MQMQPVDGAKWRGGGGGGEKTERETQRSCTQRWDAVAALRTKPAWEDSSLSAQMECERGIPMTGMSDCHHQRGTEM